MIGHADGDEEAYSLIGEARGKRRSHPVASCAVLSLVAGCVSIGLLMQRQSFGAGGTAVLLAVPETEEASTCAKPFGQCAGMNFSASKEERDAHNFTASAKPFTCCPDGMTCVPMGPIWGMCMPSWAKPKPSEVAEAAAFTAVVARPAAARVAASDAAGQPAPRQSDDAHSASVVPAIVPASSVTADAGTCAKPFGQCAGMNFSASKEERDAHNFTTSATPFTCCPDGMTCVSMGPIWGMCMPSWAKPKPSEVAEVLRAVAVHEAATFKAVLDSAEPDAAAEAKGEAKRDEEKPAEDATKEEPPAEPEAEPAACATKPYHQCAGMNFTQTKEERDTYDVTAGAPQFACCPTGTSCIKFGPVWGMCMPAWTAPAPAA